MRRHKWTGNRWIFSTVVFFELILAACDPAADRARDGGNRLAEATSPYLREHADNPVEWYEWGAEALERARSENKPLLISIGYASCHWCHVMEEESFMDTAVARMMNDNFISIKIDREQRPDIDQIYLDAAQLISGSAGWPLNAFALPDGKPFYAATYFPRDQWMMLLKQISDTYRAEKNVLLEQAEALTKGISSQNVITPAHDSSLAFDKEVYKDIFPSWESALDLVDGGLKGAPKFPMPVIWEFFLQYHHLTGDKKALHAVTTTLDRMARGGIYDQLGGGFARYSTDREWREPHFEKMLYDNAQLVKLYAHAYQVTGDPVYKNIVDETLVFVRREMTNDEGGFFSSINADSEGEEGKYYTWSKQEFDDVLGNTSALLSKYYNITDPGNYSDGKNILHRSLTPEAFAEQEGVEESEWNKLLAEGRQKLLDARSKRIRPTTDDKVLASWNALMLQAYLDAYVATSTPEYLNMAFRNARFMEANLLKKSGELWRSYSGGKAGIEAFLDDYAFTALAFIRLYEVTLDMHWLVTARLLADYVIEHFDDAGNGMFYYASDLSDTLVVRAKQISDNVMPSSNSVMAEVLLRLGEYYQHKPYTNRSQQMTNQIMHDTMRSKDVFYANWARVAGVSTYEPFQVAIAGPDAVARSLELQRYYNPLAIYLGGEAEALPLLENKLVTGKTIIYVCRDQICKLPVGEVEKALEQLSLARW